MSSRFVVNSEALFGRGVASMELFFAFFSTTFRSYQMMGAYLVLVRGLLLSVIGEDIGSPTEEACFFRGVMASQSSPFKYQN